ARAAADRQPITYCSPTVDSRVADAAWSETLQVWSPTTPSTMMCAQVWNASTDATVCWPKMPSIPWGVTPPHWEAPFVSTVWRAFTTSPVDPIDDQRRVTLLELGDRGMGGRPEDAVDDDRQIRRSTQSPLQPPDRASRRALLDGRLS